MTTMTDTDNMIILESSDGDTFPIDRDIIVKMSLLITTLLEDIDEGDHINLLNITSELCPHIIEFCNNYPQGDKENVWAKDWVKKFSLPTLYTLIVGADYMGIKPLEDIVGQTLADMMVGKTPDEIRAHFGIVKDLTPEEEAQIISENTWES